LLGGYVHQLVTDNATAEEVLKLYKIHEGKQRRK
jgi:DNA-binding transcriptional regulator LsrR (DeoR family)